ncbi:MAG: S41 family peptidase, partial [bacterium]|nr:S41 family peptidase [bacterium]
VERIFSGQTGTPVALRFRRPNGVDYSVTLTRDSGERNGFFRELFDDGQLASCVIEDEYLYVNFGRTLSVHSAEQAGRLLNENPRATALILDLRETSDGVLPRALIARLAFFPLPLGPYRETIWESVLDASANRIVFEPRERILGDDMVPPCNPVFRGRVIALVSAATSGVAEQFLQPLVFSQRVTLVGEPTAGAGGLSQVLDFGDGASVEITVREPNWESDYGNHCGFPADILVFPTALGLANDRDEALQAAIEFLHHNPE